MKFSYCGFDGAGKQATGFVDSATSDEARDLLRKQGLFVTTVAASESTTDSVRASRHSRVGTSRRLRAISTFARQLQILLAGGTPLVQALAAAERQTRHAGWKRVLADVRAKVEEGLPLSEAMQSHPEYFDPASASLAAAGETSGAMAPMLERLSILTRSQLQLRSMLVGALVYPAVLTVIGICVLCVMLLFVLPRFAGLFETLDTPLPPTTKFMLAASSLLRSSGWLLLLGIGAIGTGIWFARRAPGARRWAHGVVLSLPGLANLCRSVMTARVSRMLGVLLESKVPLIESLRLTRDATVNLHYVDLLARAEEAVSRGEPVSAVLGNSDLIHPSVQEAMRNGEQSGQMGAPLVHMAEFLDEENEVVIKAATKLLEPLILALLGVMVALMAISMFLPLFDLVSSVGGGAK